METTITTFTNPLPTIATPTLPMTLALARTDGNGIKSWIAPGLAGNGDIAGRVILRRMAQKTKQGIVGRTAHLTMPRFNTGSQRYEGSVQVRITLNAPSVVPDTEAFECLLYGINLFSAGGLTADTFCGNFVKAFDLPL